MFEMFKQNFTIKILFTLVSLLINNFSLKISKLTSNYNYK